VVPSLVLTLFDTPSSSERKRVPTARPEATTWSIDGALKVDAYDAPLGSCESIGAPDKMPTQPAWWPRSLPVLMSKPEATDT
jgi:hypothetical protein